MKTTIGVTTFCFALAGILLITVEATNSSSSSSSTSVHSSYHRQAKAFRMEKEKALASNEISQFLNTKNIVKTIVKLVFGTTEESSATSRQVLNLLVKVLDMLKTSFTQRNARSSSSSSSVRGLKESIDDAAVASISMLKGFVRSALSPEQQCVQRYICDAASQATRESREIGYLIAQAGGYASNYILNSSKTNNINDAVRIGRSGNDCRKFFTCNEKEL